MPCDRLTSVSLPHTTITAAETVVASPLTGPAHCRVLAVLTPSSDSHIEMELWLPASGWNGKFEAVGNGGWAGSINAGGMAAALREGYATASTDTGHKSSETPGGSFALGHPEKLIDYGYRAVHEMTLRSRELMAAFYGREARLSYWNGCSNGGRQGLMEAQRYPEDFDGIVAGAPAANWSGRALSSLWVAQAVHKDDTSYIPPAKYPLLHNAVLQACDALDGVKDGTLEDPVRCRFDPAVLRCQDIDGPGCLTSGQVEAARKIYAAAWNSAKQEFYPGLEPGSELGWATYGGLRPFSIGEDFFRFVVFQDPAWSYRSLNVDSDVALAGRMDHGVINALDPNLRAFLAHGGKLIQYHGWSDPQIPPLHSVQYYDSVVNAMGGTVGGAGKVQEWYRLFMVPGMQHCGGGSGPNLFNAMAALERWREAGEAPEKLVAWRVANNQVEMTRPLCPYPLVAHYKGVGSTNDARNFACGPAGAAGDKPK
ncbi:MAG TPA: tannase/feruloyl esterase family alpha/beta hydrolase [Candidatus Acidoferrales bacterium]|nr:tannase/feruloyl esterase family alpha/beta hydrolase [Candidatus Acidoferrales bacterium]